MIHSVQNSAHILEEFIDRWSYYMDRYGFAILALSAIPLHFTQWIPVTHSCCSLISLCAAGCIQLAKLISLNTLPFPGSPRVTILLASPVQTLDHCVVKPSRPSDLKSSSNISLPFAWFTGPQKRLKIYFESFWLFWLTPWNDPSRREAWKAISNRLNATQMLTLLFATWKGSIALFCEGLKVKNFLYFCEKPWHQNFNPKEHGLFSQLNMLKALLASSSGICRRVSTVHSDVFSTITV